MRIILISGDKTAHRVARENPVRRMEEQQRNTLGMAQIDCLS